MNKVDFSKFTPSHAQELESLVQEYAWQRVLDFAEDVKRERLKPKENRNFIGTVIDQLLSFNEKRVKRMICEGVSDENVLLDEISRWPSGLNGKNSLISFLGINLTSDCNFKPRCRYCNQPCIEPSISLNAWKQVIEESTADSKDKGPYLYFTGGEPLLLGEKLIELIHYATERGAKVNVNTNATMITPWIALEMIKAGLSMLHISLDTADRKTQNFLFGGNRFDAVLRGIYNVQIAREIVGVDYPNIHINCVLTARNVDQFSALLAFLVEKKRRFRDRKDPLFGDLLIHIIPVGGYQNDWLRPLEQDFKRFYSEIWGRTVELWDHYQTNMGVEEPIPLFGYFSNPFLRVEHRGGLEAYAKTSAEGVYASLAHTRHCYVAPTQATFTPDGTQYRCGAHAIGRVCPIGNGSDGVYNNIGANILSSEAFPNENCHNCALATLYINQSAEDQLRARIVEMKDPSEDCDRTI